MSDLSLFLKKNKKERSNAFFAASKSFVDSEGKPILWEIKPLTTAEDERIRDECTHEIPAGRKGSFRQKIDTTAYMVKQMVAAVVFPNLYDAQLQDSYGVKTPEDLLREMVDNPSEFLDLANFVREVSGFDTDPADEVEEAKN